MTLQKANVAGWGFNTKLTSPEMNFLQDELVKALDGVGGGSYSPSPVISIGGDGLQLTALLECQGNVVIDNLGSTNSLTVGGNASVGGDFVSTGSATFSGVQALFNEGFESAASKIGSIWGDCNVGSSSTDQFTLRAESFVHADMHFIAGSLDIGVGDFEVTAGDSLLGGALTVLGATSLAAVTAASYAVGSAFSVTATTFDLSSAVTATFAGQVQLNNAVTLTSTLTPSGAGRVRDKTVILPDADHTLTIGEATVFMVPALGTDRTYPLSDTGAGLGDRIRVNAIANSTANSGTVTYGLKTWFLRNQTGQVVMIEFEFDGTAWRVNDLVMYDAALNG